MNANAQHTPGPWVFGLETEIHAYGEVLGYRIRGEDGVLAEVFRKPHLVAVRVANARLIAAAPDLLGFSLAIQSVVRSSGANLCSTATEAERSTFISGIIDAWNNGGYEAIARATGAAS